MAPSIPPPSYPTRSLEFLNHVRKSKPNGSLSNGTAHSNGSHTPSIPQAPLPLEVIIVGAGLGGLATAIALGRRGHKVTILEQAPVLSEVGAGIQVPPNSSRILSDWGVEEFLKAQVIEPESITIRRWENGKPIGHTKYMPDFRDNFHAPYYVIHRAHLHEALHKAALAVGVTLKINSKVISFDVDAGKAIVENGTVYSGDLIVCADGANSIARTAILNCDPKPPPPTGFAVYRATVKREQILGDPELAWLIEKPNLNLWIGEDRHAMTYPIAGGKTFNMVLSHRDATDPRNWTAATAIQDMRREFAGWDPILLKVINKIESTVKWPLLNGSRLPTWISPSSRVVILGDAAHAMLPYMSQGAAMAVEDGAALGEILSTIDQRDQLPAALKVFETVRMERSYQMQEASVVNSFLWHFPDGPEQEARDEAMRAEVEGKHFLSSANQWSDPVTQWWTYGYNAEEEVMKAWRARAT